MAKTFNVTIELENEAFDYCNGNEIARILHKIAGALTEKHIIRATHGKVYDVNGNHVGDMTFTQMED